MKVTIYKQADALPPLPEGSFFHSRALMELMEATPRLKPYMAVTTDDEGQAVACLLAIVQHRRSWLPPFLYSHVRILGEGEGRGDCFGLMMKAVTERFQNRTLYMEVSHLSQKMLGYRELRRLGYFPVRWSSVHNSLHSRTPEERILPRQLRRVENAERRGATCKIVETDDDFRAFIDLMCSYAWLKPRRYIPPKEFFRGLMDSGCGSLFLTTFHGNPIGCTALVYSGSDAYLWYSKARRKSRVHLHPNAVTLWHSIKHAHAQGCAHIRFMDVGLPFRKNPYRDFLLRFGGKEVSTYRWFRINIRWVNQLASWLWRE